MKVDNITRNLMIISICLLILLSSGGFYTIYVTKAIAGGPKLINDLGIMRGSIQRIAKLEVSLEKDDGFLQATDSHILNLFQEISYANQDNDELTRLISELQTLWQGLKECIYDYRENPSEKNKASLMNQSERLWITTNDTVLVSQIITENKIRSYRVSFWLFLINLILISVIIFLIKNHVQGTLENMAQHDGLTKIYNRRYFEGSLSNEVSKSSRYNRKFSLIIFDIDHFKNINDQYGHDNGDYVLKQLTEIVSENIRETDIFARVGGEEFAIIAPETDMIAALGMSEKIRKVIESYTFTKVRKITISLGITHFNQGDSADDMYKNADRALYKAKTNGRNRSEILSTIRDKAQS